jgi:thiol:disulfide interchange protein
MKLRLIAAFLIAILATAGYAQQQKDPSTPGAKGKDFPAIYDTKRDSFKDLKAAVAEAQKSGKNIILEVGGNWCIWCHIMHKFFASHPELRQYRDENYVAVPVNWSEETPNEKFLSQYPKRAGYPHLFVLDASGKLLHSQNTAELEEGRGYSLTKMAQFLQKWAPKKKG